MHVDRPLGDREAEPEAFAVERRTGAKACKDVASSDSKADADLNNLVAS